MASTVLRLSGRTSATLPARCQQPRRCAVTVSAAARQQPPPPPLSATDRPSRRVMESPEPLELPARNSSAAIASTIKYRIKPRSAGAPKGRGVGGAPADGAIADFISKLKLAWNIFFPDAPPEIRPKEEAKQRLRMILVADRCGMSPTGLTEMKRNILSAIEEFVDIDSEEQIDVNITTDPDVGTVYSVAVPIRRVKPDARLPLDAEGGVDDLTFEWNPEDMDSDPSARFPYGT